MTNEIIGRPQGRRFGEPFSPLKTPPSPTKPADAQSVANAAYRIYERLTGKPNSDIRAHVHDTYGASVYDWWKVRRFGGNAAEYLAYVSRDAVIWACELAAKQRHIKWQDAVAMAGDAPDTTNSEDPKRDIAAWVETLDFIIAQGELTPGAPAETYAEMRAQHRAKLQEKYAEQKEKQAVALKQEKSKQAALDAAKKTAALKDKVEPAVDKLNAAIAELEAEQDDLTPAEGTDAKTGEIIPVEPANPAPFGLDYFGNPVKHDPAETNRAATVAHFAALYNINPENIEAIVRGLNKAFGAPWHKLADKLSMDEIEKRLNAFYNDNQPKTKQNPEQAKADAPEPPKANETAAETLPKPTVENRPVGGDKTPPVKDTTNKPLVLVSYLAKMTTLTGVPVGEINMRLDAKHDLGAYKPIELAGGKIGTDLAQWAVRNRLDEVFGPHGIGWKLEPHSVLGSITHEEKTMPNGNLKHIVTLIGYVFKYRVVIGDEVEWIELSPMSDSDGNTDKGYAFRGAQTSLLKQVLRSLGGINHLYQNKDLARWANDEYAKRKQRKAG